jgi:SAM-dependent methyltransferase
MGMSTGDLELLLRLRRLRYIPLGANVIEVGAQQIANSALLHQRIFEDLRREFECVESLPWPVPLSDSSLSENGPLSRDMWLGLGCSYQSIDIDGSPDAIRLDLNCDCVPAESLNAFDLVTNYGTTEHVANQMNAFKVMHDLTKPGGIMVHNVPAQGYPNHGLFNYNAKFFWVLCRSNGYKVLYMGFSTDAGDRAAMPRDIVNYMEEFDPIEPGVSNMEFSDVALIVALQKEFSYDYVSALDVPTGTAPATEEVRKRYWTVFTEGVF